MGVAACAGVLAAVVVLDPGRNTSANRTLPTPPRSGATTTEALPFSTTISATDERARQRAEAVVRPLGGQFVNAMIHRTNTAYSMAHRLRAPGQYLDSDRRDQLLAGRVLARFTS